MKELVRETYLEKLSEYCNKYDNIAILNQVKAFVGEDDITLSDVYADFELVSKEEYDRGNGKIEFADSCICENPKQVASNSLIDELGLDDTVCSLGKMVYKLTIECAIETKENCVIKKSLYLNVKDVEDNHVECLIRKNSEDTESIATKIKIKIEMPKNYDIINKIKDHWIWVRGYEIVEPKDSYYIMEPFWYKTNEELTQEDKDFFESDFILEEDYIKDKKQKEELKTEKKIEAYLDKRETDLGINGMVVLSEPGGGKTTYLKHLIYELLSYYKNPTMDDSIFTKNGLDKNILYIPFFVRARDLIDILNDSEIKKENLFDIIIESNVLNIIGETEEKAVFFQNRDGHRNLFVLDGFEELNDEQAEKLLDGIYHAYCSGKLHRKEDMLIISSRYKEYGYQKLVTFCIQHKIVEKYIKFDNKNRAIDICVSKWFDILKKTGQNYQDYFNQMRTSNSDIRNLITTPLELTGIIMLCQMESALPTDITILYRSIIEIWLTYGIKDAVIPFFSLSDIFLELSVIAYYMAEAEDRLRISRDKIKDIIKTRRVDLRRYYRSNSYVAASSEEELDRLIDFWFKRNIFVKNSNEDIYEFAHREYQSYLIAYAIINNFIPKTQRKLNRIKYIESHMEEADDFWDRVIIFSAFMSTDLHDDLIEYIFEKLQIFDTKVVVPSIYISSEDPDATEVGLLTYKKLRKIDEYLFSIVLQLTNAEGFYFADDEYELLFEELLMQDRIPIMKKSVKSSEIKKLLLHGRKDTNTLFLKKAIELMEECNTQIGNFEANSTESNLIVARGRKSTIIDIVGDIVFHVAWNCDADREMIKKAVSLYLSNWITMDIIYEIKDSLDSHCYNPDRVRLFSEIGLENCSMIISIILGFINYGNVDVPRVSLYRVALDYFYKAEHSVNEKEKLEAIIVAFNIVFLTTWFLKGNDAEKCNCALKYEEGFWDYKSLGEYLECVVKITDYMKVVKADDRYKRDLYATYRNLCLLESEELREKIEPLLFDKDIFRNCLYNSQNETITKKSDGTELSYIFEIIASYPLTSEYMEMNEVKSILGKRIEEMEDCRKSTNITFEKETYLLKLLVFAGAFEENGKLKVKRLESEIKRIRTYSRLTRCARLNLLSIENYMEQRRI